MAMTGLNQPILSHPDKLGLLIQCRQKMDQLNESELQSYAQSVLSKQSPERLKSILFVGFNSIKRSVQYSKLQQMNVSIDSIIQKKENKKKKKKNKEEKKKKSVILKVTKHASLSKVIPSDILGNNVCSFLMMRDITSLARCDRKFAIICHSPIAVTNIMHRHDPYPYGPTSGDVYIDGDYHWKSLDRYRVKNVTRLSLALSRFYSLRPPKCKQLSLFGKEDWSTVSKLSDVPNMHLLKQIEFVYVSVLSGLRAAANNLSSISFVNCEFLDLMDDFEYDPNDPEYAADFENYNKLIEFILPSQPNNLQTLKFINSHIARIGEPICKKGNDAIGDIERIKTSLSNLRAFVYDGHPDGSNLFFRLAVDILSNFTNYKLNSIHIHSTDRQLLLQMFCGHNLNALSRITELCISVAFNSNQIIALKQLNIPKLKKICLVIDVCNGRVDASNLDYFTSFKEILLRILSHHSHLELLQIVFSLNVPTSYDEDDSFCVKGVAVTTKLVENMTSAIMFFRNHHRISKRPLLFRIYVRSCHQRKRPKCSMAIEQHDNEEIAENLANNVNQLFFNYLVTYPLGKIQFKWTYNALNHSVVLYKVQQSMKGLDGIFRIAVKEAGSMNYDDKDRLRDEIDRHYMYAISASKTDLAKHDVHHQNQWSADCKWCCNTPWV